MRPTLLFLLVLGVPAAARAQTETATLNVAFTGVARLSFSANSLTFPDADPDTMPLVPATGGAITITAKARANEGGLVTLSVQASDDLRSGVSTIPAAMITWTGTGPGFVPGTLSAASPQTVAQWPGSGARTGTQSFFFRNLWTHPTGVYTVTLVYTLSAQ